MPNEPDRINPKTLNDYLEIMTKAAFQSGMSWKVIEAKWDGFQAVFDGFDPEHVAGLDEHDVDELVQDARIVRNRRKIEATVHNAETMLRLSTGTVKGFQAWLRSFDDYAALEKAIRKEFKFMGPSGIYMWLWVVNEDIPDYHTVFGD
ncbi:MAG: DNA-3-methyladenine glycosylase I [Acidimicrobiia bacterium]|nr:DNA-3-methyladenine glycosylase I [Acidimicrobiia bacterium]